MQFTSKNPLLKVPLFGQLNKDCINVEQTWSILHYVNGATFVFFLSVR